MCTSINDCPLIFEAPRGIVLSKISHLRGFLMANQLLEQPVQKRAPSFASDDAPTSLQFEKIAIEGYEQVIKITDQNVGLSSIVAIHNTSLGPALGGIRIRPYGSFNEALDDVLRLSKGMTYKSAIAETGFGGGKSVIIADPKKDKTPELLLAFGAAVEKFGGRYICAEDAGCTVEDVKVIRRATKYVVGLPNAKSSGDPGTFTAWGVYRGIQSAAKKLFGSDALEGRSIAIQGLGSVGARLAELLFWAGAELTLCDVDMAKAERLAHQYRAKLAPVDQILKTECDILAPCALGGIINDKTLPFFRCKAIAGATNNQLLSDSHATVLQTQGILYAPDFVINAGGLLNVTSEVDEEGYNPAAARYKTHHIYDTLLAIYEIAEKNRESTHAAALSLANYRIKYGIGKRVIPPFFHHTVE
jgi:leucine dehydrogenase